MANSVNVLGSTLAPANPRERYVITDGASCNAPVPQAQHETISACDWNVSRIKVGQEALTSRHVTRKLRYMRREKSSASLRPGKLRYIENGSECTTRQCCLSRLLEGGAELYEESADRGSDVLDSTIGEVSIASASDTQHAQKESLVSDRHDRLVHQNEGQLRGDDESAAAERNVENLFKINGRRQLLLGTAFSGLVMATSFQARKTLAVTNATATAIKGDSSQGEVAPSQVVDPVQKASAFRIYDASVLGEPVAVGKDKGRLWQKLLTARVVYLGEAESVPDPEDKVLELEIVRTLRDRCFEQQRPVSLALEAFPCTLQQQLNRYMSKRLSDNELRGLVPHWSDERWQEYQPLLHYCRSNGVRLMAGGTPLEVLRTVQAKGVQGLSDSDRHKYVPPTGGGFGLNSASMFQQLSLAEVLPNASVPFGPGPYRFAQARMVEDHTMSQVVVQAMADGGSVGLLIVIVGATHVLFGSKGAGLPARISKKLQKRTQAVILLNPERQRIRKEGELPEADFLWYSAAKQCSRNCFDRAEIARVMDAAGRRRDALPKDLQTGIDLGLISPEVLKDFFDLEKQPFIAELSRHFQGFRERWLADPRFLQRLGIEEAISITTTLIAQYERRKGRFFKELDYVITDTLRGAVVDFFTVWLPAPTLSFRASDAQSHASDALEGLKGLLGSLPDNAFQRATGVNWGLHARILAVVVGGLKLSSVGFVASVGTVTLTNTVLGIREYLNPQKVGKRRNKRSPVVKTALVYGFFLGTSANLRYQAIAGIVEHWIADYYLSSQPVAGNILSFLARTANSYWGTQQWVDLAKITGLQAHNDEPPSAVTEQLDISHERRTDTIEALSCKSELPANQLKSDTKSWEVPLMDCMISSAAQNEDLDEKAINNADGHES